MSGGRINILRVITFIKGVQRQNEFAALPSPEGINFLANHQKTLEKEKKSKLKGRQK